MASSVEVPGLVASATGEPLRVVAAVARSLRPTLYPTSAKGGGQGLRHLGPEHLTALVFGLALHGITRTTAVDLARLTTTFLELGKHAPNQERTLPRQILDPGPLPSLLAEWQSQVWHGEQPTTPSLNGPSHFVPFSTAGASVAGLIDWISRPHGRLLRQVLRYSGADVTLAADALPEVIIRFHRHDGISLATHFDRLARGMYVGEEPLAAIRRSAKIRFALIEVLADAWADSRLRTGEAD